MSIIERERDREERVFKALADYRRRAMLDLLKDGPRLTGEICAHFAQLDRCTVMQHLCVLENADLIIVKRAGRRRWNYLNAVPIKEIYDRWISGYAAHALDVLSRIKHDLEGGN
jgi:DNA-binding transcriptional ArsR family regulator